MYEEPHKPDDPVNFVRRHMGSEDFFILGDGKVQNAEEEELVLSSLIEKKADGDNIVSNTKDVVEEQNPVPESQSEQTVDGTGDNEKEDTSETVNAVDLPSENSEVTVQDVDQLVVEFERMKSDEECTSMLKAHLTDEIFEKLKNVNSDDGGVTLYDCIKSGLENHDTSLGIYATDLQCYDGLRDIFDPIIETYHGFGCDAVHPNTDWGDPQTFVPFSGNDGTVLAIRVSCTRNMQEYPVVCRMAESELSESLGKVKKSVI